MSFSIYPFKLVAYVVDFSVCMKQVIFHLSNAIITAIPVSHPRHRCIERLLVNLAEWDARPNYLRVVAYKWCSEICKEFSSLEDGKELLFLSLEIGSRGLDLDHRWGVGLIHVKHYQCVLDIVFSSGNDEVIADPLQAWIAHNFFYKSCTLLTPWAEHLIHLEHVASTSKRLQLLVIDFIGCLGFQPFEQAGVEGFFLLLDHLGVGVDNMPGEHTWSEWLSLLFEVVQSPGGRQSLGYPCWELIPELAGAMPPLSLEYPFNNEMEITTSLEEEQEWDRLECWMGFIWFLWHPLADRIPDDLERVTLLLLHQQPRFAKKLEQWLYKSAIPMPGSLDLLWQICEQAGLEAALQHDTP